MRPGRLGYVGSEDRPLLAVSAAHDGQGLTITGLIADRPGVLGADGATSYSPEFLPGVAMTRQPGAAWAGTATERAETAAVIPMTLPWALIFTQSTFNRLSYNPESIV